MGAARDTGSSCLNDGAQVLEQPDPLERSISGLEKITPYRRESVNRRPQRGWQERQVAVRVNYRENASVAARVVADVQAAGALAFAVAADVSGRV
jgi:hypothetical protein